MPRSRPEHLPSRPTWRCAACGIAWPCSPAKLRLLGEYWEDRAALAAHLLRLREEAAGHLTELNSGVPSKDLDTRFTDWVQPRG
jgi:hypothetical protein